MRRSNARVCAPRAFGKGYAVSRQDDDLRVTDFDFELPPRTDRATSAGGARHEPHAGRGSADSGSLRDAQFSEFPSLLRPRRSAGAERQPRDSGAALCPAHTCGASERSRQGRIEVMLTEPAGENEWRALVRPGRKIAIGERLVFPAPRRFDGAGSRGSGTGRVWRTSARALHPSTDFFGALDRIGHIPLPPYIHRDDAGRRSRALSDGVCARARIGGGTHRGPALHAGNAGSDSRAGRRDCARHAARGAGDFRASAGRAGGRRAAAPGTLQRLRRRRQTPSTGPEAKAGGSLRWARRWSGRWKLPARRCVRRECWRHMPAKPISSFSRDSTFVWSTRC